MSDAVAAPRNAGPAWGFEAIHFLDQKCPRWLLRQIANCGTWVAMARMPEQRRYSREFLSVIHGRPPRLIEVWRHFRAFLEFILLRLRVAHGVKHHCRCHPDDAEHFESFLKIPGPALLGTFHFGRSDMLGFFLSERGRSVAMVRLRMGNAADTERLGKMFGDAVSFIWANEPSTMIFAIKSTLESGHSLVMDCDRIDYTSRTEGFRFLGKTRTFPFTIYHLSILFGRPVMFCIGLPEGTDGTLVLAFPAFIPDAGVGRPENLARARTHFQSVLDRLETLVRQNPSLWFNFLPLNPEVSAT